MTTGCACESCGVRLAPRGQQCTTCQLESTMDPLVRALLQLRQVISPDLELAPYGRAPQREAGS
jgi:hypothetical protein